MGLGWSGRLHILTHFPAIDLLGGGVGMGLPSFGPWRGSQAAKHHRPTIIIHHTTPHHTILFHEWNSKHHLTSDHVFLWRDFLRADLPPLHYRVRGCDTHSLHIRPDGVTLGLVAVVWKPRTYATGRRRPHVHGCYAGVRAVQRGVLFDNRVSKRYAECHSVS